MSKEVVSGKDCPVVAFYKLAHTYGIDMGDATSPWGLNITAEYRSFNARREDIILASGGHDMDGDVGIVFNITKQLWVFSSRDAAVIRKFVKGDVRFT